MTPIYGLTEGGVKKTGRDPRVLPKTVIYDPELTLDPAAGDDGDQRAATRSRTPPRGCTRPTATRWSR